MNFQTILEELDRLYEEDATKEVEEVKEEKEESEALTEAAEEETVDVEEAPAEEEIEVVESQLVLECAKCGALAIKAETDVVVDEETALANVEEPCQYCEEAAGYKVIGTFNPYEVEEPVEETEEESAEEEVVEEGLLDLDLPVTANVNVKADGNSVPVLNTGI